MGNTKGARKAGASASVPSGARSLWARLSADGATSPLPELLVCELTTLAPVHCRSFATTEHLSGVASFSEGFRATIVEWGEDNISTLTGSP